ncbi:hypothetical protein K438DRAFT_2012631 [Mycena galopus ATCC 62051]|nr:hypothetical protein K438DRAFT_2012631 [Mycena galopus ATCC 62051]
MPADVKNLVFHTLKTMKPYWLNVAILALTRVLSIIGAHHKNIRCETAFFSVFYYFTGLGLTARCHRRPQLRRGQAPAVFPCYWRQVVVAWPV